ncbi:MAG TPA: hypothetical protein PLU30_21950 [Verrucomicrobiae bacterium]|nr:hypothetical protein [Verrucomicrobiae bacterium]
MRDRATLTSIGIAAAALGLLLGLPPSRADLPKAADAFGKNGDFEKGLRYWEGQGKVTKLEDGNSVCALRLEKERDVEIRCPVSVEGAEEVEIRFRVRAMPGYEGAGLRTATRTGHGATFRDHKLVADGGWKEMKCGWSRKGRIQPSICFAFVLYPGKGEVQFDDFVATVK